MAFPSSVRRGMPFPRLTHDHRRSHFGPGLSVSPLRSPGCTGKEEELPVLFTTPHSFFIEFEKRHFNSSRVPLRFGKGSFPCLSPGLIRSSFVPQAMAEFYGVTLEEYQQGQTWRVQYAKYLRTLERKARSLCAKKGFDWDRMNADLRGKFVDTFLKEP